MGWVDWAPIPAGMFGSSPLKGYWLEVKGTPQQQQQRQRQRQRQWQRPERRSWRWGNGLDSLSNGHDRRLLVLLLLSNVDHVGDNRSLRLKSWIPLSLFASHAILLYFSIHPMISKNDISLRSRLPGMLPTCHLATWSRAGGAGRSAGEAAMRGL